ncbi:MAG: helix-turn-helix domain-containing protein [Chloroflexi bacterium]|nr:helix-turn-helix domain-containing protein [Chloroflexota bacterium]
MSAKLVNIIFGMKVRQARTEAGLTLSEFAGLCELSPSYVTEIEYGRKYPRADKIMRMADALNKDYDDLVSIKLAPSLSYLESTLSSSIMRRFPFEEFGLEASDLVKPLTREPEKVSALMHAILSIGRKYDFKEEEFLRAALRSYQEIHENYFQDLEEAALSFTSEIGAKYGLGEQIVTDLTVFETILKEEYGYSIDLDEIANDPALQKYRSIFFEDKRKKKIFINSTLHSRQIKYVLAREIGYRYLNLKERSFASTPNRIDSFQQIVNDFKAAYFGGALMMSRQTMLHDLQQFFDQDMWQPQRLLTLLDKYEVTPEMLLYRMSELIPQYYGIKLHFLRFHYNNGGKYELIKQLNMNQLIVPSGIGLHEHYCRRWLSVRLLQYGDSDVNQTFDQPTVGVQFSEFVDSRDQFLCFGFSRPLVLSSSVNSSVLLGFRVDAELRRVMRFIDDPAIQKAYINETCERCSLTVDQCQERAAPPTLLIAEQQATARRLALSKLREKSREG